MVTRFNVTHCTLQFSTSGVSRKRRGVLYPSTPLVRSTPVCLYDIWIVSFFLSTPIGSLIIADLSTFTTEIKVHRPFFGKAPFYTASKDVYFLHPTLKHYFRRAFQVSLARERRELNSAGRMDRPERALMTSVFVLRRPPQPHEVHTPPAGPLKPEHAQ